ncbi:MAG: hypothetical protein HZR80_09990 [Candidatus Heimdallarchaeota archaeon]
MTDKPKMTPEQRIKFTCDLSNTVLSIFLSNLKKRFPDINSQDRKKYLIKLVKERERIRRL